MKEEAPTLELSESSRAMAYALVAAVRSIALHLPAGAEITGQLREWYLEETKDPDWSADEQLLFAFLGQILGSPDEPVP